MTANCADPHCPYRARVQELEATLGELRLRLEEAIRELELRAAGQRMHVTLNEFQRRGPWADVP